MIIISLNISILFGRFKSERSLSGMALKDGNIDVFK